MATSPARYELNASTDARLASSSRGDAASATPLASQLQAAFAAGATYRLRKRQQISFDSTPSLFFLQQGQLATTMQVGPDRRSIVELHFPGDMLSSHRLGVAEHKVVALNQAHVRRLPLAVIERQFHNDPELLHAVVDIVSRQNAQARLHCALLTRFTGEERLATFLMQLASRAGRALADRITVPLPISREDIADFLGLNADTVSRLFTRFKKAGYIELHGRSDLHIINWTGLRDISPFGAEMKPPSMP